jgi:uncharacterized protein YlzI (FlbEa/FlbD family)
MNILEEKSLCLINTANDSNITINNPNQSPNTKIIFVNKNALVIYAKIDKLPNRIQQWFIKKLLCITFEKF